MINRYKNLSKQERVSFLQPLEYFNSDKEFLGLASRRKIHSSGKFHYGVQCFIIKKYKNKLYILSQIRNKVDIAYKKLDHSCAVQMLPKDKRNPILAIKRALKEELDIVSNNIKTIKCITLNVDMRVSKRYSDEPDYLYNREFVNTVLVELYDNNKIKINTQKIFDIKWVEYKSFVNDVLKNPCRYAKNLQSNFINKHLDSLIYSESCKLLHMKYNIIKTLSASSYYSDKTNIPVSLSKFTDGRVTLQILQNKGRLKEIELFNISNNYFKKPNLINRLLKTIGEK